MIPLGGVGFYIKTSINFVVCSNLNVPNLENLCLEIRKHNSKPFLIATWYTPPCSSIDLFLHYESFLEKLDSLGLEYYLLGDLNCNLASLQNDSNTRRLCEISDLFGLQQLITEPTRITESSSTLIDLISTNCADRVVCCGVSHIREFKIPRLRTTTTDKHASAHDQNHVTVHFSRVVQRLR